ncbi:MAG: hydantoinase/oxoprolinase family protein [Senegalia sp. (in: firmicutes)]|uniref:hydantoinase/oxoprolinase family protein n=1 Tax=Senegalia sp. (in: firmicutes) TaxID=1924098 RepID=UPI003F998374
MIVLGYLQIGDGKKAEYVISNLGKKINKNAKETSQIILDQVIDKIYINIKQILDKINSRPIYTIKELLSDKKVIPESINIIGGPAKILAPMIEKKFNLPCNYPKDYDVANAIGSALAKATTKITLNIDTNLKKMNIPELNIYEDISGDYTLNEAKNYALELLAKEGLEMGLNERDIESEIIEESSFNMVEGFFTKGKIIRVVAQIKPGLIESFRGDISES